MRLHLNTWRGISISETDLLLNILTFFIQPWKWNRICSNTFTTELSTRKRPLYCWNKLSDFRWISEVCPFSRSYKKKSVRGNRFIFSIIFTGYKKEKWPIVVTGLTVSVSWNLLLTFSVIIFPPRSCCCLKINCFLPILNYNPSKSVR